MLSLLGLLRRSSAPPQQPSSGFVMQIKRERLVALLPSLSEATASRARSVLAEARYDTIWLNEGDGSGVTFTRDQLREVELALPHL